MHRYVIPILPLLILGLAVGLTFAEDKQPGKGAPTGKDAVPDRVIKPFLWEIPGEVPSYLFGTAHVVDKRVTTLHPLARKAFDKSEAAYFEVDMIKDAAAQLAAITLPAGQKTADMIPAELLERLDARLTKIHPMVKRSLLGELKPFAWVLVAPSLYEQMKKPGVPMLDAKLYGEAQRAGKTVGGLEKPAEQTAFVDGVTNEEAVLMLRLTLDQWDAADAEGKGLSDELLNHYLRGDGPALAAYAMEMMAGEKVPKELAERLMKGLAYDRNERIAKAIAKHLKDDPKKRHFFAVGTMHLLGKQCVQEYLKSLGVETRRVKVEVKSTEGQKPDVKTPAEKKPEPVGAGAGSAR